MQCQSANARFYRSPRGLVAARVLRQRLRLIWPDLRGAAVLGLGWTEPFLPLWQSSAGRLIEAVAYQESSARGCLVAEDRLPFADMSFDRVLLVHAVEQADDASRLLREVWRVLKDDGRLLVVAPNRLGLWAHSESTPFGHGEPFSPGQIGRLLTHAAFRETRRDTALYTPPVRARMVLQGYRAFETVGRAVVPHLAGVILTEAEKDSFAAIPLAQARWRRVMLPDAI